MSNRKVNTHLYDPQCTCQDCSQFERGLQDMIRNERNYRPHWAELSRPINENTFKK
jgi:hypothetical protein